MVVSEDGSLKRRKLNPPEDPKISRDQPVHLNINDKNGASPFTPTEEQAVEINKSDFSNADATKAVEDPPLSKRQLKKLKKQEQWEAAKELRKDKRKDKRHEKQARKAQAKAELQEKIANGEIVTPKFSPEELKAIHKRPDLVPVTLLIDCDFDELMTEKELISLGAQLTRCYSDNKHSKHRAHIAISSWNGALRTRFETVLTNHHKSWRGVRFLEKDFVEVGQEMDAVMRGESGGKLVGALAPREEGQTSLACLGASENKIDGALQVEDSPSPTAEEPGLEAVARVESIDAASKCGDAGSMLKRQREADEEVKPQGLTEQPPIPNSKSSPSVSMMDSKKDTSIPSAVIQPSLVYLTSDSPHTLDRLSPYTSYIIGGIVDKNRHKGICYKRACERGIPTAKLPIGEYMTMQSRTVLTTNHVVEIMLKWLDTGDWGEAFLSVIPKRKEAKLKIKTGGDEVDKDEESQAEDGDGDGDLSE